MTYIVQTFLTPENGDGGRFTGANLRCRREGPIPSPSTNPVGRQRGNVVKAFVGRAAVTLAVCLSVPTVSFAAIHGGSSVSVARGDSLYSIAHDHGVSVDALMQANGLHSSLIRIGQKLIIPGDTSSKPSQSSSRPTSHTAKTATATHKIVIVTVRRGDTVSGISSRYGASVSETLRLNGLTDKSILHIGEKIKVSVTTGGVKGSRGESSVVNLSSEVLGLKIADYAKTLIGVPYRWGGTSPSGFDCSGFVQYVFAHFGVHLGRTSYAQHDEGSPAPSHYPNIGDLVFFDTDGPGASHVGIYIGNGEFINAEDRGVRIDSLSSSYWSRYYLGAKGGY